MDVNELVKQQLLKIADDLDKGASKIDDEGGKEALGLLAEFSDKNVKLSKYQACAYLGKISRAKFDSLVADGVLPKGRKQQGFKELF